MMEILANWWYFWWYDPRAEQFALAVSYSKSGAHGRIRTGDPLFTNRIQPEILAFHVFTTRPLSPKESFGLATELATVNRGENLARKVPFRG